MLDCLSSFFFIIIKPLELFVFHVINFGLNFYLSKNIYFFNCLFVSILFIFYTVVNFPAFLLFWFLVSYHVFEKDTS